MRVGRAGAQTKLLRPHRTQTRGAGHEGIVSRLGPVAPFLDVLGSACEDLVEHMHDFRGCACIDGESSASPPGSSSEVGQDIIPVPRAGVDKAEPEPGGVLEPPARRPHAEACRATQTGRDADLVRGFCLAEEHGPFAGIVTFVNEFKAREGRAKNGHSAKRLRSIPVPVLHSCCVGHPNGRLVFRSMS